MEFRLLILIILSVLLFGCDTGDAITTSGDLEK